MFTLPGIPTQDKYNTMLKEKEQQRDRKKREKMIPLDNHGNSNSRSTSPSVTTSPNVSNNTECSTSGAANMEMFGNNLNPYNNNGCVKTTRVQALSKEVVRPLQVTSVSKEKNSSWGPVQVTVDESSDPIVQQIRIIENYIKQAREAKRWEEVNVFEQNLKDLNEAQRSNNLTK